MLTVVRSHLTPRHPLHVWKCAVAQETTVRFIDDLDGSEGLSTFDFSLGGRNYQIDLSDENAAKLRDALTPSSTWLARPAAVPGYIGRRRWQISPLARSVRTPLPSASGLASMATK